MNKDLTKGDPQKILWAFCLPMFGSIIFQQLYNIADSLVAGRFIGENALAAVGNSYNITLIFIAFAFGCNMGCSVIVSQLFGAKDYARMKTAVYTTLIASAVLCIVLMLAGVPVLRRPAAADEDAAGDHGRFRTVSGYLHIGTALFTLLQYRHRDFLRTGRFEDTFPLPGLFFHGKYRSGHPVCRFTADGNSGRSLGNLPLSGSQLHFLCAFDLKRLAGIEVSSGNAKVEIFPGIC